MKNSNLPKNAIEIRDLTKIYKNKKEKDLIALNSINLEIPRGSMFGLLGPNGAGKTTTFYMMVGLISPNEGDIFLNEENITNTPMYQRARKGVGYLSQEASVFRNLTVRQNLESVLQFLHYSKKEIKERCDQLIEEFSLQRVVNSKGYSLSGGERRRTEIARALVTNPKFILLDEPFAGVDPIAVEDIQEIVSKLRHQNIGILITDHNVRDTLKIVDRAYILHDGRVIISGLPEDVINNDNVRRVYLGKDFNIL